jgi:hypothetical protein
MLSVPKIENVSDGRKEQGSITEGKLGRRRVAANDFPMQVPRYSQARAHFGAAGAATFVGGMGRMMNRQRRFFSTVQPLRA